MANMSTPSEPHGVMPYNMLVGTIIQRLREKAGLSQAALAKTVGLTQSAYSRIESGQTALTISLLRTISIALGSSPEEVLSKADSLSKQLIEKGVDVPAEKPADNSDLKAGLLIGLGVLVFLWAANSK